MEGRTIVRPDRTRRISRVGRRFPSMEGRTIVRPDFVVWLRQHPDIPPSMEGRTIVRPDQRRSSRDANERQCSLQWRAGQLSGQTCDDAGSITRRRAVTILQWRAGQLSGQTPPRGEAEDSKSPPFNGGPDNCPARPGIAVESRSPFNGGPACILQWRAGQLSGQTRRDHIDVTGDKR